MAKKKKKDEDKKKKKEVKKKKKDKKKKDKDKKKKKGKKDESSSSSSSGDSSSDGAAAKKKQKGKQEAELSELIPIHVAPKHSTTLAPPEDGILRFEFTAEEEGQLGVRFGPGFPPLILSVAPESPAGKKGVPPCHEVHAVNGLALIPHNLEVVMPCLMQRPVTLDVRPQGWKPPAMAKEIAKKKAAEQAELDARKAVEIQRREQVAQEKKEQQEREAAEARERELREAAELEAARAGARKARAERTAKEEGFNKIIESEPLEFRQTAQALMEAAYGSTTQDSKAIPLRLFTRRREVAWTWAGEVMELIGGGVNEDDDSWDA